MSWLSQAKNATVGWVVGKGNRPGDPETREFGYNRDEVSTALATQIASQVAAPVAPLAEGTSQGKLILGGAAALGLLLLTSKRKRR